MDAHTRRANFRRLITVRFGGSQADTASALGKSPGRMTQLLTETEAFGERVARSIESVLCLPTGWLDQPLRDAAPTDKQSLSVAAPAITLAQALPVVLGRLPWLDDYTAGLVLEALRAATRPAPPLERIEADLLRMLDARAPADSSSTTPDKRSNAA